MCDQSGGYKMRMETHRCRFRFSEMRRTQNIVQTIVVYAKRLKASQNNTHLFL